MWIAVLEDAIGLSSDMYNLSTMLSLDPSRTVELFIYCDCPLKPSKMGEKYRDLKI